jgi:hypothetical protein
MTMIRHLLAVTFLAGLSDAALSEIVGIGGQAEGYFPSDNLQTEVLDEDVIIGAYSDEQAWIFYTLFVYKNHGQTPSERWFRGFVKGQETIAGVV